MMRGCEGVGLEPSSQDSQDRKGTPSDGSGCPPLISAKLMEEVERLSKRHQTELNECLQRCLQSAQEQPQSPRSSLAANAASAAVPPPHEQRTAHPCVPASSPSLLAPPPPGGASTISLTTGFEKSGPPQLPPGGTSSNSLATGFEKCGPPQVLARDQCQATKSFDESPWPSSSRDLNADKAGRADKVAHEVACSRKRKGKRKHTTVDLMASPIEEKKTVLQQVTTSRYYEWASGVLIVLNAAFIGWQAQQAAWEAEDRAQRNLPLEDDNDPGFVALQVIFTILFTCELMPRWIRDGFLGFFADNDRWWNILDVTVVSFSVIDLILSALVQKSDFLGNLSVLRVLRVVRVVRVARVIRVLKFFRELRMMIFSILRSMKSLLWVILVLGMTFYIFGITFTVATTMALDTSAKWRSADSQSLRLFFGTLDRSVLSLFMAMSGGNDWAAYYEALELLSPLYRLLFLLYISFAIFAVVNIVTGVFVESAMQSNLEDRDITVHEELENKREYLRSMRSIFEEMDDNGSGFVSVEEFEAKLDDERVVAYFNAMKLDVSDARRLFWLIDSDHSQEVDIDEFLSGVYSLQGDSRALDMKLMQVEVRCLQDNFVAFSETLRRIHECVVERGAGG